MQESGSRSRRSCYNAVGWTRPSRRSVESSRDPKDSESHEFGDSALVPQLSFNEQRVLGVLIEKSLTTPEQYPLTVNSLVNGSNQKSCRDPISYLVESEVEDALESLREKQLLTLIRSSGGRTDRYKHRMGDTLQLESRKVAIIAELLLRGPQTDGELRQRASRMVAIPTLQDLAAALDELRNHQGETFVRRLGPEGRKRGTKYAHTMYPPGEAPDGGDDSSGSHAHDYPHATTHVGQHSAAQQMSGAATSGAGTSTAQTAPSATVSHPSPTAGSGTVPAGALAAASEEVRVLRADLTKLAERVDELESTFMRFFK